MQRSYTFFVIQRSSSNMQIFYRAKRGSWIRLGAFERSSQGTWQAFFGCVRKHCPSTSEYHFIFVSVNNKDKMILGGIRVVFSNAAFGGSLMVLGIADTRTTHIRGEQSRLWVITSRTTVRSAQAGKGRSWVRRSPPLYSIRLPALLRIGTAICPRPARRYVESRFILSE